MDSAISMPKNKHAEVFEILDTQDSTALRESIETCT